MNNAGLLIMIVSVAIVTTLFCWCLYRVIRQPGEELENIVGGELHTPDMDEE